MMKSTLRKIISKRRARERVKPIIDPQIRDSCLPENEEQRVKTEAAATAATTSGSSFVESKATDDGLTEISSRLEASAGARNQGTCLESVLEIMRLGTRSEYNRKWFEENGTARVLAVSLAAFASCPTTFEEGEEKEREYDICANNQKILGALLSALHWLLPLPRHDHAATFEVLLGSAPSLRCILWFLKHGDHSSKRNSVLVLKELVLLSLDSRSSTAGTQPMGTTRLEELRGLDTKLFDLIKESMITSPTISTSALEIVFHLLNSFDNKDSKLTKSFVGMGLIDLLMEVIASVTSRNICEKALGIVDVVCRNSEQARRDAYRNALTIPVLVKKILRVSQVATDFSVSTLWILCKMSSSSSSSSNEEGNDSGVNVGVIATEALRVGAFQKLLLVLQIGCRDATKEQVTYLLKLLNSYRQRDGVECIEPGDLKDLKRRF